MSKKCKIQYKNNSGTLEDLDIQAKYDGDGNDIASTYVTKTQTATFSTPGLVGVSSVNPSKVTVNSESTIAGRYYPIELNSDGKAIVNVPWSSGEDTGSIICYGTSSTSISTAQKVVTIKSGSFELATGAQIIVKFSNANSANSPTLNVNNTGAKSIYYNGTLIETNETKYILRWVVNFIYDGSSYHIVSSSLVDSGYTQKTILPMANSLSLGSSTNPFSTVKSGTVNTNKLTLSAISSSNSLNASSYNAFGEVLWSGTKTKAEKIELNTSIFFNYYMLIGYNSNTEYSTIIVPYDSFYQQKVFLLSSGSSYRWAVIRLNKKEEAEITGITNFTFTKIIWLGGPKA